MVDLEEAKKRGYAKIVLIIGSVGSCIGAFNLFALSPIPARGVSIAEVPILIILAVGLMIFLSNRSRVGRAALLVLPETRVYVAFISLLLVLVAIFRTLGVMGVERSASLIVLAVLLSSSYLMAILSKSAALLSRHGYPAKGVHVIFLTALAVTVLSFVLRLVVVG